MYLLNHISLIMVRFSSNFINVDLLKKRYSVTFTEFKCSSLTLWDYKYFRESIYLNKRLGVNSRASLINEYRVPCRNNLGVSLI